MHARKVCTMSVYEAWSFPNRLFGRSHRLLREVRATNKVLPYWPRISVAPGLSDRRLWLTVAPFITRYPTCSVSSQRCRGRINASLEEKQR